MPSPAAPAFYGSQRSDMGGIPGSSPRQAPEDYLEGDERPGQRHLGRAFAALAAARGAQQKGALRKFLNVLGERQDTGPAVQGTISAGEDGGGATHTTGGV